MNILPLFAGITASMLHVITGPDHLAAVSPLAIESKRKAWKVGLLWGTGHVIGMLIIGILVYLFRDMIPFEKISAQSEQLVGVVLVVLGIWTFVKIYRKETHHKHPHFHTEKEHTPFIHVHTHQHQPETRLPDRRTAVRLDEPTPNNESHTHTHARPVNNALSTALFIGIIHGLAGVAHFLLLLPVLGFQKNGEAALYIIGFGIGSVLAMSLYALILGRIATKIEEGHNNNFSLGIRLVAGMVAIIIGLYWFFAF